MSVEELTYALETYIRESSRNYVDEAMALVRPMSGSGSTIRRSYGSVRPTIPNGKR